MKQAKVAYEVPMGVVEVGKDEIAGAAGFSKSEQIYDTSCKDVHPREVQDWFAAWDGKTCITISSDVAVFDWIDPTDNPVNYPVLQPILLASRKSCNSLGNYYLQPGNHSFIFSLFSHAGDWKNGYRSGTQTKQPLQVVITNPKEQTGYLPETFGFGSATGKGIVVSTLKKCDDDDSVILHCYDIEGKNTELSFNLFKEIGTVEHTNIIEEEGRKIHSSTHGFSHPVGHHAIETFKLQTK
ncbi:MAG: glycosyl hydrolase-related protein [Tannerellaceae bacterium]|nr:glycosyl hydrolase-related protein [Tannerellaceae bacterium]MCD8263597.1 glycosyl hydrolase-related protein [Tannerellaceae bacterium]